MNSLNNVIVNDLDLYSHMIEERDDYLAWDNCKALDDYRHYYIRNATVLDIKQQCCFCVMNNIKKGDKIVRSRGQGGSSDFFRTYHIECMANMLEQIYVNMKDSLEEMKTLYKIEATPYKLTREYINIQCRDNIVKQINERLHELGIYNYVEWWGERFIVHQHGHEFAPRVNGEDDCSCKVNEIHVWKSVLGNAYIYSSTRRNLYGEQQQIDQDMFIQAIEDDVEHPQEFSKRYSFLMESIMEAIKRIDNNHDEPNRY
tara:strand:+ start:3582 stop:4355 length:774 start_codon:yes stop_codon:yes gene_type:complete